MGNTFNLVSKGVIFQELHVASGDIIHFIPFVRAFYVFVSPLFYSHCNHESKVLIIPSTMETCQGDPLGGALFVLVHFKVLCFTTGYFPLLSISLYYRWHSHHRFPLNCIICIWTFPSWVLWDRSFYPTSKSVTWSPSGLLFNFDTPSLFNTPSIGIRVLGVPLGTSSFTSTFVKKNLLEDVQHVDLLLKMGDV